VTLIILIGVLAILLGVLAFFRVTKLDVKIQELELKLDDLAVGLSELKRKGAIATQVTQTVQEPQQEVAPIKAISPFEPTHHEYDDSWKKQVSVESSETMLKVVTWLKENWAGFFGVSILVLGITFGTVYLSFFASPFIRFLMLIGIGVGFLGAGQFFRSKPLWQELSGWLQSASGAIILFACIGTGYFQALHFYQAPIIGLYLLFTGLIYNLVLAYLASKETLACLHVVISLLALMIVPKELIVFVAAVVVTLGGIGLSFRYAWNINVLMIFLSFTVFHYIWLQYQASIEAIAIWGIIGTCLIGSSALLVHYQKAYQRLDKNKNLFVHISIWVLFGSQLVLYNLGFAYLYIPLSLATIASFGLAYYAKKRNFHWLFICDTLVAQVLATLAILSLYRVSFQQELIAWIALMEALSFATITYCSRQILLSKVGAAFIILSFLALCSILLSIYPHTNQILYIGIAALVPLYGVRWYLAKRNTSFESPIEKFDIFYPSILDILFFALMLLLLFMVVGEYHFGYVGLIVILLAMSFNKILMIQHYHRIIYLAFLLPVLFYGWFKISVTDSKLQALLWLGIPPVVLMLGLLKEKIFTMSQSKLSIEDLWVYLLGMHLAVTLTLLLWSNSTFLPGICFLVLGVLFFESSLYLYEKINTNRSYFLAVAAKNTAIIYLLLYCIFYVLLYLQSEASILSWLSVTQMLTMSALLLSLYWYFSIPFSNKQYPEFTSRTTTRLLTVSQAITFDIAVILFLFLLASSFSAPIHPIGYALLACVLSMPYLRNVLPKRALIYSICLLFATCIQVAIVSSNWASPLSTWYQKTHVTGPLSMIIALAGASCLLKAPLAPENSKILRLYYKNPVLIGFLPIFIAIALFLFWRFDKAYLTMLWVIEIVAMVMLGYFLRSKYVVHIAFAFLAFCVARLITYDLAQTDLLVRALVFVVVGILMIFIHVLYKKFAGRLS
jgi:hypothetical protein